MTAQTEEEASTHLLKTSWRGSYEQEKMNKRIKSSWEMVDPASPQEKYK